MPSAAAISSMAMMRARLAFIGPRRRAPWVAIDTWSSWLAEVGAESTEAGCDICLFSLISAAAVHCGIMKPELRPGLRMRKGGSSEIVESISAAMRRSDSEPISATAMAMMSAAKATGSAWKLPPDSTAPSSAKTSGLSDTALASITSVRAALARRSRQAPITCGWQRKE